MTARGSLGKIFLGARPAPGAEPEALEHALAHAWHEARAAWPKVRVERATFVRYLAARVPAAGAVEAIGALHISDLYLACACAHGNAQALAELEAVIVGEVPSYVSHLGRKRPFLDELRQRMRKSLLVQEGERRPRILDYAGQGPLGAWLRVVDVRTALNLLREEGRAAKVQPPRTSSRRAPDPELRLVEVQAQKDFDRSLRAAIRGLSSDERNVLRMHYLDGLSIDQVGALYRVSRATAARWIAEARRRVVDEVRKALRARWKMTSAELDSLARVVQSKLEISLRGLFR